MRSKTEHNQHLHSKSWRTDNVDWVRQFRSQIQIKTQYRINIRKGFCWLYLTFSYIKQSMTTLYFLWRIEKSISRTSKYSCKTMPAKIHRVISQIKHTQIFFLCLGDRIMPIGYGNPEAKKIETSRLRVHKIYVTTKNRRNARTGFSCMPLTFVSI